MGVFDLFKLKESEFIKMNNEIYEAVTKGFIESNYIKPELLPHIFEKIKEQLTQGFGFTDVFSYDDCLSLEEKKSLNLPTKKKISREMMNSLTEEGKKLNDPKGTIEHIFWSPYNKIKKSYDLAEMKRRLTNDTYFLGYQIIAALDFNTCIVCGAYDGKIIKTISELDEFENRICYKDTCCGCEYVPVEKGMGSVMSSGPSYAGWFRKLSIDEKKIILGEYLEKYKKGETLKDIILSLSKEAILKHFQDRKERENLKEIEEAKKPKVRQKRLTEEEIQEFRDLLTKRVSNIWSIENIENMVERVRTMTPKDQHSVLNSERKSKKK